MRPLAAAVLVTALLGGTAESGPSRTLVFSDEFTGSALDTTKWNVRDQERTESGRTDGIRWWCKPANVHVIPENGGNLAIDLRKLGTDQYAGGRVDTDGIFDFTHGTLEVRVHVPPTEATWVPSGSRRTAGAPSRAAPRTVRRST
ncbi:glycoside hydrolase family 16 protein [Streptomyces sp. ISL-98]|uniref:glycoside hydrolase family 16 protein n=1 Tax=Streptomyces sp. ISL-98 TaxID=2819192 RepID=UPI001BE755C2|nr:glycoside hydrolase family 16 protein [Streptomyces sp. ISL-98]MBT2505670.1 glycoside hydrolase family 16 protein [Streptomyces sp. ISL-98]